MMTLLIESNNIINLYALAGNIQILLFRWFNIVIFYKSCFTRILLIHLSNYTSYDKVSANTASCEPQYYKKSDESQDAFSGSPDIPNESSY